MGGKKKETAHKTNDSIFNVIRGKNTKYLAISRDMIIYNDGRRLSDTAQFDKLFFFKLLDLRISFITIKRVLLYHNVHSVRWSELFELFDRK